MVASTISQDARFSRQAQLVHPRLQDAIVAIGGVGMLGSWAALGLARCVGHVFAADPDVVEDVNSGNQAYNGDYIGLPKVEALARLASGLPLTTHHGDFPLDKSPAELFPVLPELDEPRSLIVMSGADSFAVRALLANYALHHNASVFVDTRAMGELTVVCIVPQHHIEKYLAEEIIDDKDAPDAPCGATGTAWVGMAIAGRVISGLNAHYRGMPNVPSVHVEQLSQDVLRSEVWR